MSCDMKDRPEHVHQCAGKFRKEKYDQLAQKKKKKNPPGLLALTSVIHTLFGSFKSFETLTSVNIHKQHIIIEQHKEPVFHALLVKPSVTGFSARWLFIPALLCYLFMLDERGHS